MKEVIKIECEVLIEYENATARESIINSIKQKPFSNYTGYGNNGSVSVKYVKDTIREVTEQEPIDLRSQMEKAIDIIKQNLPEDQINRPQFVARLEWILNDYNYRAPELKGISWGYFNDAFDEYLGEEIEDEEPWVLDMYNEIVELLKEGN